MLARADCLEKLEAIRRLHVEVANDDIEGGVRTDAAGRRFDAFGAGGILGAEVLQDFGNHIDHIALVVDHKESAAVQGRAVAGCILAMILHAVSPNRREFSPIAN